MFTIYYLTSMRSDKIGSKQLQQGGDCYEKYKVRKSEI